MSFSHFDTKGQTVMVDVTSKQPTQRTAIAEAKGRRHLGKTDAGYDYCRPGTRVPRARPSAIRAIKMARSA